MGIIVTSMSSVMGGAIAGGIVGSAAGGAAEYVGIVVVGGAEKVTDVSVVVGGFIGGVAVGDPTAPNKVANIH